MFGEFWPIACIPPTVCLICLVTHYSVTAECHECLRAGVRPAPELRKSLAGSSSECAGGQIQSLLTAEPDGEDTRAEDR